MKQDWPLVRRNVTHFVTATADGDHSGHGHGDGHGYGYGYGHPSSAGLARDFALG
jgi:hypothetical protein